MRYSFNIDRLVNLILPFTLRTTSRVKLFQSLLKPVEGLVTEFNIYRQDIIFKTQYSGQQKSLKALLNKKFDPLHGRISIETASDVKQLHFTYNSNEVNPELRYVYYSDEANPFLTHTYNSDELLNPYSFIVKIPADCDTASIRGQMKGWVDYYRFSSTNFIFQAL